MIGHDLLGNEESSSTGWIFSHTDVNQTWILYRIGQPQFDHFLLYGQRERSVSVCLDFAVFHSKLGRIEHARPISGQGGERRLDYDIAEYSPRLAACCIQFVVWLSASGELTAHASPLS